VIRSYPNRMTDDKHEFVGKYMRVERVHDYKSMVTNGRFGNNGVKRTDSLYKYLLIFVAITVVGVRVVFRP